MVARLLYYSTLEELSDAIEITIKQINKNPISVNIGIHCNVSNYYAILIFPL